MTLLPELATTLTGVAVDRINVGTMPSLPDKAVVLYEYPGLPRRKTQTGTYQQPRIQVNSRSKNYVEAGSLIWAAYNALASIQNQDILGVYYVSVEPLQDPFYLRKDENDRHIFAFNAQVIKRPS